MAETEVSSCRDASFWQRLIRVLSGRELEDLREERRRFLKEKNELLEEIRSAVKGVKAATDELKETADNAVKEIEQSVAKMQRATESVVGERVSLELLQYWKQGQNWHKNAIRSLEALAHAGRADLAQWAASKLRNDSTIKVGRTIDPLLKRLAEGRVTSDGGETANQSHPETSPAPDAAGDGRGTHLHAVPSAPEGTNGAAAPRSEHAHAPRQTVEPGPSREGQADVQETRGDTSTPDLESGAA